MPHRCAGLQRKPRNLECGPRAYGFSFEFVHQCICYLLTPMSDSTVVLYCLSDVADVSGIPAALLTAAPTRAVKEPPIVLTAGVPAQSMSTVVVWEL